MAYVDTRRAAAYLGCSVAFLEKTRGVSCDDPIPYVKLHKKVLYDTKILAAYMASHTRLNTSEPNANCASTATTVRKAGL